MIEYLELLCTNTRHRAVNGKLLIPCNHTNRQHFHASIPKKYLINLSKNTYYFYKPLTRNGRIKGKPEPVNLLLSYTAD